MPLVRLYTLYCTLSTACPILDPEMLSACVDDVFSAAKNQDYYCQYGQSIRINSNVTASFSFIEVYPLGKEQEKRKTIIMSVCYAALKVKYSNMYSLGPQCRLVDTYK